jgi:hypothetical protein
MAVSFSGMDFGRPECGLAGGICPNVYTWWPWWVDVGLAVALAVAVALGRWAWQQSPSASSLWRRATSRARNELRRAVALTKASPRLLLLAAVLAAAGAAATSWFFFDQAGPSVTVTAANNTDTVYLAVGQTLGVDMPGWSPVTLSPKDDAALTVVSGSEVLGAQPGPTTIEVWASFGDCVTEIQFQVVVVASASQLPERVVQGPMQPGAGAGC